MNKSLVAILGIGALAAGAYFVIRSQRPITPVKGQETPPLLLSNPISNILTEANLAVKSMTSLGEKNNNPMNIKWTADSRKNPWVGQIGEKGAFVVFKDPAYSFRAGARILNSYASRGINTIASIIQTYAPAGVDKNETKNYISFVARKMGKLEFSPITKNDYPRLLQAMAKFETGKDWDIALVNRGLSLVNATS